METTPRLFHLDTLNGDAFARESFAATKAIQSLGLDESIENQKVALEALAAIFRRAGYECEVALRYPGDPCERVELVICSPGKAVGSWFEKWSPKPDVLGFFPVIKFERKGWRCSFARLAIDWGRYSGRAASSTFLKCSSFTIKKLFGRIDEGIFARVSELLK